MRVSTFTQNTESTQISKICSVKLPLHSAKLVQAKRRMFSVDWAVVTHGRS